MTPRRTGMRRSMHPSQAIGRHNKQILSICHIVSFFIWFSKWVSQMTVRCCHLIWSGMKKILTGFKRGSIQQGQSYKRVKKKHMPSRRNRLWGLQYHSCVQCCLGDQTTFDNFWCKWNAKTTLNNVLIEKEKLSFPPPPSDMYVGGGGEACVHSCLHMWTPWKLWYSDTWF